MGSQPLLELTQAQRDRLAYVELRLRFVGSLQRQDLVARFDIQAAAATRDIAQYKDIAPRNLEYDATSKVYVRGSWFKPVFEFPTERVLAWVAQGFGDGEPMQRRPIVAFESSALPTALDLELLSVLTRAIYRRQPVEIGYRGLSSGLTTREIVPFALAHGGQRWHVRAYDRRSAGFRDFALTRLSDARLAQGGVQEHETSSRDIQWNRITELELVPHPANVQHPDTVEAEFGMENGVLKVGVRAAMAGYLLHRWNVDCTEDHSLKGPQHHLWLRNRQALYGVTNLALAPGYTPAF